MDMTPPTLDDIRTAAARIAGAVDNTPMSHSGVLSKMIDADLWLKFENLQYTAAYKERGALNKLLQLTDDERRRGVIAASAGNHAQAVAYHGKRLGIPVTIVMPNPTPTVKVTQTEGHGARVVLHGDQFDDAYDKARELEAEEALVFVHPFDDPQDHCRRRHHRARNARGGARPRRAGRPDRRRRADLGRFDRRQGAQARHRNHRRRGRALPVDEECRRGRAPARSAAIRWPRASRSRSPAS